MKTHRLMSSVREKAGLFKLLLCLAFLFFGLLKQVNIAVESKTIGVIFPPYFVSVISFSGWAKILKQNSLSSYSLSEKEKRVWMVWNCLRKPVLFFFRLPASRALTFVADLSLIFAHARRQRSKINGGGPFTNWEYWSAFEKLAHKFYSQCLHINSRKRKL